LAYKLGRPFSFEDHDYSVFSKDLKLCTIKSLHDYYDLLLVNKILEYSVPNSVNPLIDLFPIRVNKFNTRSHRELVELNSNRDYVYYSPLFRLRRNWNCLDSIVKLSDKMCDFKNLLFDKVCKFE